MKKLLTVLFVLISLIAKAQPSPTSSQVRFPAVWVQFRDTATARPSDTACIFYFNNNFWVRRNSSSFFQNLLDGSGTVTSIAQGFGIVSTPNPITTAGTVTVDTLAMSTKANVQKVKDSVVGVLGNYVQLQQSPQVAQTGGLRVTDTIRTSGRLRGGIIVADAFTQTPSLLVINGSGWIGGILPDSLTDNRNLYLPNASGTFALRGDTTGFGTKFIYNQTGSNLSAQTAKALLSDSLGTLGVLYGERLFTSTASINPAVNGRNTSTGRAGSFTAATGVGAYITNRSATNPALYVLQDSTSSIARFVNNFDLGVMIDTSADITISNLRSGGAFTGKLQLPTISDNRTYTLPDASGIIALTSNVTDSSSALRAAINTKLNISDTSGMLANRLKISDTAAMLNPGYARTNRFLDTTSVLRALINTKGTGTVTSVGLSLPSIFTVSGSPVTTSGTLTASLANQNANLVFASPTSGSPATPTFRSLVEADIPDLSSLYPTVSRFSDSISAIRTLANSKYTGGTVTSVATNNGTGITGGTITTTGTLAIDTATTISTRLNVLNQLNKYTGSTNIVTLGTITTGVWNGTAIANANLQNSSITINGNSVSLGGSTTVTANTPNSITFNNGGAGGASGSTFNGGSALTVSYNTLGALATADTAGMLSPYLRKSDTATAFSGLTFDRVLANGNTTGRTFTAGGATLTGALSGTSGTFSGDIDMTSSSNNILTVRTTNAASNGLSTIYLGNNSSAFSGTIEATSSNYTPYTYFLPDGISLTANRVGGLALVARNASGIIRFFSGGDVEAARFTTGRRFLVGTTTDDGSSIGQFAGDVLLTKAGNLNLVVKTTSNNTPYFSLSRNNGSNGVFGAYVNSSSETIFENQNGTFATFATTGAATFSSSVTANSLIKSGGTSSQFLMADGSTSNLIWNRSSALISTNTAGDSLKLNATNGNANYIRTTSNGTFQVRDSASGVAHFTSNTSQSAFIGDLTVGAGMTAKTYSENVVSVSTTYTVANDVGTVFASSNTYTITLPSASGNAGRTITIKRTSSGLGTSITISGVTLGTSENGGSLPCHAAAIYKSDGTNWYCISYHAGGCN